MRFLILFKLKHINLEHNQLIFDNWRDRRASKHMLFTGQRSRHEKTDILFSLKKQNQNIPANVLACVISKLLTRSADGEATVSL